MESLYPKRVKGLFRSLSLRLLALTMLWVSFISMCLGYTVVLGWQMEASSTVINRVESMKTGVYQVNAAVNDTASDALYQSAVRRFAEDLEKMEQGEEWLNSAIWRDEAVTGRVVRINREWIGTVLPLFTDAHLNGTAVDPKRLTTILTELTQLQQYLEKSRTVLMSYQRWIQLAIIMLAVGSLFVIMALLLRWVIRPTEALRRGIESVTRGNLSTRVNPEPTSEEFERIGQGFNAMAGRLEDLVENLEGKVTEKTQAVEEKNRNLAQLYELSSYLGRQHSVDEICEGFTARLMHFTNASGCAVFLLNEKTKTLELAAGSGLPEALFSRWAAKPLPLVQLKNAMEADLPLRVTPETPADFLTSLRETEGTSPRIRTTYVFHIRSGTKNLGIFLLCYDETKQLAAQNYRLYESFGSHLGVAIDNIRLIARDQQYAVVQERTLMAQGLHDSIAQSLSFLNIQVQLLESGLKNDDKALVNDTVAQIRTGVQECYEDVRELLLNFRERLHKESFAAAIATAIERFEIQTKLKAQIISEGKEPNLTDKQQLQVIFIMQEALANVRKHSHATDVRIVIDSRSDFTLTVMDNGCGIDMELLKQRGKRHVGMNIMRERAEKIGASVAIGPVDASVFPHGTAVRLSIPAALFREVH